VAVVIAVVVVVTVMVMITTVCGGVIYHGSFIFWIE